MTAPASKGVDRIDAPWSRQYKGSSKTLHPFKAKNRRGAGRTPAQWPPYQRILNHSPKTGDRLSSITFRYWAYRSRTKLYALRRPMGSRIGTTSSRPMESRSVTPSAPYSTGAAQQQCGGKSSCRKSEPFSIFLEITFAHSWAKAAQPAHFWASWEARLVTHFWADNSRRFPKMGTWFYSFLSISHF